MRAREWFVAATRPDIPALGRQVRNPIVHFATHMPPAAYRTRDARRAQAGALSSLNGAPSSAQDALAQFLFRLPRRLSRRLFRWPAQNTLDRIRVLLLFERLARGHRAMRRRSSAPASPRGLPQPDPQTSLPVPEMRVRPPCRVP